MQSNPLKQNLLAYCHEYVDHRIATATQAMVDAQRSANEEEKSSAGDKYETGRAMMQIERDKSAQQLNEAQKLKQILDQIDVERIPDAAGLGSVVLTRNLSIFIAIGIGKAVLNGKEHLIVAPQSPLGKNLINKKVGGEFVLANATERITQIF